MKSDDVMRVCSYDLDYDEGGDRRLHQGELFTGIAYVVDDKTGNLVKEWPYLNGYPSGVCQKWYPNGQLQEVVHIDNEGGPGGKMMWYPNGRLKSISISEYGAPMSYKNWDEDGHLIEEYELDKKTPQYDYVLKRRRETKLKSESKMDD